MTAAWLGALVLAAAPAEAPWELALEPNHASFAFSIPIAGGMTRVRGAFARGDVKITWDETALERSSVEATLDAASVDTNNDARDADLRGEKFFDVARHPRIVFRSRRIEKRGPAHVAVGDLTIRGVTRPVELPFTVTRVERDEGRPRLGVSIRWSIPRLDYGVGADWRHTAIPAFLGETVDVEIDLWTRAGRRAGEPPKPR